MILTKTTEKKKEHKGAAVLLKQVTMTLNL